MLWQKTQRGCLLSWWQHCGCRHWTNTTRKCKILKVRTLVLHLCFLHTCVFLTFYIAFSHGCFLHFICRSHNAWPSCTPWELATFHFAKHCRLVVQHTMAHFWHGVVVVAAAFLDIVNLVGFGLGWVKWLSAPWMLCFHIWSSWLDFLEEWL